MNIQKSSYLQMRTLVFSLAIISIFACAKEGTITRQEIEQAQKLWGEGVVAIGKAYCLDQDYTKVAEDHVDSLYAYQFDTVLFKPTKASKKPFRLTREGAVSYFVGGNLNFPEDEGFALEPWIKVRFENAGTYIHGDCALAMGNYFFTPKKKKMKEVKVEYSFGYIKNKDGKLKIILHHSSLPYTKKEE